VGSAGCLAMATGIPMIVSAAAGSAEAVVDGHTGYFLPDPFDRGACAHLPDRPATSDSLRTALGRRCESELGTTPETPNHPSRERSTRTGYLKRGWPTRSMSIPTTSYPVLDAPMISKAAYRQSCVTRRPAHTQDAKSPKRCVGRATLRRHAFCRDLGQHQF
jgi:hypothetical protein